MTRLCAATLVLAFAGALAARGQDARSFSFEGGETFTNAQLEHALRRYDISLKAPIEPTTADDAAYFLREFFYSQGFPEADVDYRFSGSHVAFLIAEGPRLLLGSLEFEGTDVLSAQHMHDIMTAEIRQQTLTPFGRLRYVERAVESGTERIRTAMVQEGYLDAQVEASPTFEGKVVNVAVHIEQGQRYTIRRVSLEGGEILPEARAAAEAFQGSIYKPGQEALCRSQMLDTLRNNGFFEAQVEEDAAFHPEEGSVEIFLTVRSGVRYHLGKITVDGNRHTLTGAIMRRLGLRPGVIYNASEVDAGVRRLWFSGAFSDVDTKENPRKDKTVDLDLTVTETTAKQISATVGYGEWDRAFADVTYTDRNFFGTLNRFSLRGYVSTRTYGVIGSLSDPWFLQTDAIATLTGYFVRQEQPAFRATEFGTSVGVQYKFSEKNLTGWQAAYEWKAVTDSTVYASNALDGAALNYRLGALTFRQTLDRRNDLLSPMKGYFLNWEAALASDYLLGEISFFRLGAQATWYLPLRKITPEQPFIPFIVLNHRAGLILPYGNTREIPIQERFFLGGPDTVRSFQLDGMAPRDSEGDPEGGLAYLLGNVEIQWPIWKLLYVAAFVDAGNLSPTLGDLSWGETRVGVGLGGRIYTPLGAVRLDYGHNLIRKDGDPLGAWQFGFGFTF